MKKVYVRNSHGVEIENSVARQHMDEVIADHIETWFNVESAQELFDKYVELHEDEFGEEWELAKLNPIY